VNNPDAGLLEMFSPSTLFRRGAPGQGADAVSTKIHGGAAAVKKRAILYIDILPNLKDWDSKRSLLKISDSSR